jgi:hypothetical protein
LSTPSPIVRLSLPAMTAVIAALTVLALLLVFELHWGVERFGFFAVPVVVAIYYLNEYRKLPYEPQRFWPERAAAPAAAPSPAASPPAERGAEETFEDPVEEADRIAAQGGTPPGVEEPVPESTPPAPKSP